jgi:hypothetical protein
MPSHEARINRAAAALRDELTPAQLDRVYTLVELLAMSTAVPFMTVQTPVGAKPNTRGESIIAPLAAKL